MANVLIIVDPDDARRARFVREASARIAPMDDLTSGTVASGPFQALWARGAHAPVFTMSDETGASVVWGMASRADGRRLEPAHHATAGDVREALGEPLDGYFAAASFHPREGLRVSADLIGTFPVFWWAKGPVTLAGSSPELFRHHPAFRACFDVEALAAILLTTHPIDGRTLVDGVRRLAPGHVLHAGGDATPVERLQYALPISERHYDLPFSAQVELLHDAMVDAVERQVPNSDPCTLSLSGGRDSRLLAGLLQARGNTVTALSFGEAGDNELRCATAVARACGFPQRTLPLAVDPDGRCAVRHARWLHCSTDFGSLHHWNTAEQLHDLPAPLATGYIMDSIIGGSHIGWAYDRSARRMSFETFFARINRYGIAESTLGALFRQSGASDLVQAAKARIAKVYASYSDVESQRAWCFDLHHRQRFHVGNSPWLFSFGLWPTQPAVDRRVLEVAGGMPAATLAERRAEDAILRRFYPRLAELPLDRNSFDTEPLSPRLRHLAGRFVAQRLAPAARLLPTRRRGETRFFHRLYDFDGVGWRAARRLAEAHRQKLDGLFARDALDAYLPPPDHPVPVRDAVVDTSGRKSLVGLMLWAGDNL